MDSTPHLHPNPKRWLFDSTLAPHIDAYIAYLKRGRYASNTTQRYLVGIAHFARWMKQTNLALIKLDEAAIVIFLDKHLPCCDCPAPVARVRQDLSAACGHLLEVLRNKGAIPMPALATGSIEEELRNFDTYMSDAQGLTFNTRRNRIRIVRRFLVRIDSLNIVLL